MLGKFSFILVYINLFIILFIHLILNVHAQFNGIKADKQSALAKSLLEEALSSFNEAAYDAQENIRERYEELKSSKKDEILRYQHAKNMTNATRKNVVENVSHEVSLQSDSNNLGLKSDEKESDGKVENAVSRNSAIYLMEPRMKAADFLANRRFLDTSILLQDMPPSHESRIVEGRCNVYRKCPDDEYCDGMYCYKCRHAGEHCDLNGVCCEGSECQYGYCTEGVTIGDPGTFCDLSKDCKGDDVCCIHEISISKMHSICKPMLNEHESCGPINLFHQDVMKASLEPICGPCKRGLSCKGVGILGRHSICLPDNEE